MAEHSFFVRRIADETPLVRSVVLEHAADAALPGWEPGAHIRIKLPDGGERPYSLVDLPDHRSGRHYALGIRRDDVGQGGSRYMHGLTEGDRVVASGPFNNFPLDPAGAGRVTLVAGGIGITPILSMAAALARQERAFSLHYFGRAPGELAFLEPLRAICGDRLVVHYDAGPAGRPDFAPLRQDLPAEADVYVCGPKGLIEAVGELASGAGVPAARIRFELFAPEAAPAGGDEAFEVEIRSSGAVVPVAPGESIIDALEAAGIDVVHDCRRGDCGICQVGVLEGVPDHRDVVLTPDERASNAVMQICVSRAKSSRLVLDL